MTNERYIKWHSSHLNMDIEMLVYGYKGMPLLIFPTSMGRFYEAKDFRLIHSIDWFLREGFFKVYCIDGIDRYSWYNRSIHPADRVKNHIWYDLMVYRELVPWAMHETGFGKVAVAGCSFGGYHAVNFGLKHPDSTKYILSMSGAFNIKGRLDGYYDDNVYFNNPPDFLPNAWDDHFRDLFVFLGAGEWDICLGDNYEMADLLGRRGIRNWLDIRPREVHDWPLWRMIFPHYLSMIVNSQV
ncbi:alpha/beta hydrolase-fold protein [Schleiferia thermophila]|jgi:esterase/lipase superfamily enzyme|uniref:Esterase/lipase superfamily enzyme n=1 Tax=Schleiferia thermophila TaxID=884107 RepID=A0A368ZYY3_9FLAO|nr:alpha/beta hydrolase-fold protein [Schleiferia thermophila]KFD38667.1 esterase [Schleiferia thermophila str. Yellowstone]RCX02119.1 esterase/lipase superfamily enzyme [Schleiferia thermophila]